jgi:hypothetical protein
MVGIRFLIIAIMVFIFLGCVSKKEIQLESLSLISKQKVDESYLTQKYVSSGGCVTTISQRFNQPNEISDKFLRIVFSSKEKVFFNILENKGQPPYVHFKADDNRLTSLGLCPLIKREDKHYINTLYYPISMKKSFGESFNLNKSKRFSFYLRTVDYFRWKTNEIIITKDMIDKLNF